MRHWILEVGAWVREYPGKVVEVHPEVSLARLARSPLAKKKSWAGLNQRRSVLADAGLRVPEYLGEAGVTAAPDDVLDATVVAWSALRVASGGAVWLPDPPVSHSDGWPCAIWA